MSITKTFSFVWCFSISRNMLQEGAHGKWTVSSSDESAEENSDSEKPCTSSLSDAACGSTSGPQYPCSEARKAAHKRKASPVKFTDTSLSAEAPPVKQRPSQEGSGWCLSSSDEEPEDQQKPVHKETVKEEKHDVSKEHPLNLCKDDKLSENLKEEEYNVTPSEAQDTWDLVTGGNPFRFFLTKVSGIERNYNSGALHIKGEQVASTTRGLWGESKAMLIFSLWVFLNASISWCC